MLGGDSLYTIALQFETTIEELRLINRLTDDVLSVGQQLILPGCESPSPEDPNICDNIPFDIFIKSDNSDLRCEVVEISESTNIP